MKQLITLLLILLLASCKKDQIDPRQAILGKWDLVYYGNGEPRRPFTPSGYHEFLPDSIVYTHIYDTKNTSTGKYWFDSLLHMGSAQYSFKFYADTLELYRENVNAIFHVSKYKRIH